MKPEQSYPEFSVYSYQPDVKEFITAYVLVHCKWFTCKLGLHMINSARF